MKTLSSTLSALRLTVVAACLSLPFTVTRADVVIDWNSKITEVCEMLPPPGLPPFLESRAFAIVHLAMRDAIATASRSPGADVVAAAIRAAHDTAVSGLPMGTATFDLLMSNELASIPDGRSKTKGVAIGAAVAANMLAQRAQDGAAEAEVPYIPGRNPGNYQFTPPFDGPPFNGYAAVPKWGKVKPFALRYGAQFRVPPPYKVTDLEYTFDLNEIQALGGADSPARTPEQRRIALFWYENSSFGWNRIARIIAAQHALTMREHAQLFATLNVALSDAYVAALESKYTYNFWRPITAIRAADSDGNPSTVGDPAWQPLFLTPPIPDYPSAHACAGGAAAVVLIATFGNAQTFTLPSTMSFPFPDITPRTFHRISDAAKENAYSRMLVGIHFRLACETGLAQGTDVGTWVVKHLQSHSH